jgi:putative transcriptional regulator
MMIKNRLKKIRMREYEMNQKEFAAFLDIPYVTYNNYENNNIAPGAEALLKIAKKLNRPVEEVYYLTNKV